MNKRVAIIISPNYKDYAEKYLSECADSVRRQDYPGEMKIFLADNESSEQSFEYLKKYLPDAEIIRNQHNDGFAKGNNDCIKRAMEQGFDYVMLINMDAAMEKDCVRKMVEAAGGDKVGAVQARLMLYDDPSTSSGQVKINSLGNVTHFLGFGYTQGHGEVYKGMASREICYPSGAAVMFKAGALKKVGLFDEEFWMYNEDQDLGWRLWLNGSSCVMAPEAVAYHKYDFNRSIKKYYFMDRNRILSMIKNYHWATLALILPAFIFMEFGLIFFAAKNGWLKEKMKVYAYFLRAKNWRRIAGGRKMAQNLRQVSDCEIVKLFSGKIWYQEIDGAEVKLANIIFNIYWQIAKRLIFW